MTITYEPQDGRIDFSPGQIDAYTIRGETYLSLPGVVATLRRMADQAEPTSRNGATCLRAAAELIGAGK